MSPKYYEIVLEDEPRQSDQQENNVNTRYIYRRIHNEYIHQGAINKRFIPVLVGTGKSVSLMAFRIFNVCWLLPLENSVYISWHSEVNFIFDSSTRAFASISLLLQIY